MVKRRAEFALPISTTTRRQRSFTYVHEASPVEIQFEEIQWPKGWVLPWAKPPTPGSPDLVKRFGPPYYSEAKGGFSALNEPFWAGLYADENVLLYEPEERSFYAYDPQTGLYCPESESALAAKISARMLEASRQMNVEGIEKRRTANTLSNIVRHLCGIVEKRGAFKQRAPFVHLANGVVVFRNGVPVLVPFSPDYWVGRCDNMNAWAHARADVAQLPPSGARRHGATLRAVRGCVRPGLSDADALALMRQRRKRQATVPPACNAGHDAALSREGRNRGRE